MSKREYDEFSEDEYVFPEENEYSAPDLGDSNQSGLEDDSDNDGSDDHLNHESASPSQKFFELCVEKFPIFRNKKLIIIGGVLVVVVIFFQFHGNHSQKVTQVQTTPTPEQQMLTELNDLKAQVSTIAASQQKMNSSISSLQNQVQTLKSNGSSSVAQRSMERKVNSLNSSVSSLSDKVNKLEKSAYKKQNNNSATAAIVQAPPVTFYIRSIEPGRAWIEGTNHTYTSIAVGDEVKDYGKVTRIDSVAGKIYTTSNRVIIFGKNDA